MGAVRAKKSRSQKTKRKRRLTTRRRPATKSASSARRKQGSGKPERYSPQEVSDALLAAHGFLSDAARRLGCHRDTVANYIERHPEVAAAKKSAREDLKDLAEGKLVEAIRKSRPWAICFFLKTQAKDRGYTERTEIAPESVDQMARKIAETARELRAISGLIPPPPAEAAA